MTYVVIDMDGATLDEFEEASAVKAFVNDLYGGVGGGAEEIAVVEYSEGDRIGSPLFAREFVDRHDAEIFRAALARMFLATYVGVATAKQSGDTVIAPVIDLALPADEGDTPDALVRHSSSHYYPLAA
jgi:hypothetical protein